MTKNVTLAIDETLLARARAIAARKNTSVNEIVRNHLEQLVRGEDLLEGALKELRAMSEQTSARLGKNYRFDREAAYGD
jgi:CHASE3 domain sensor protein